MTIRFLLLVNKQGQTRLANYNEMVPLEERRQIEGEIVRKCIARSDKQCSFVEHRNYKVIYRRYASLFFIVGRGTHASRTCTVHRGEWGAARILFSSLDGSLISSCLHTSHFTLLTDAHL